MVFFHARIIFIILSAIYYLSPLHGYPNAFLFTFLQGLMLFISGYGLQITNDQEKCFWFFMFIFIFVSCFAAEEMGSFKKYLLLVIASLLFISLFFIKVDDKHVFTINRFFYPFAVFAILTIAFIAFVNFRWETVDEPNFSIYNHPYVADYFIDDDLGYRVDLREYGWMYHRDRVTGFTKVEKKRESQEDPVLVIYEDPYLEKVDSRNGTIAFIGVVVTLFLLRCYINQNLNPENFLVIN